MHEFESPRDIVARYIAAHPGTHHRRLARELGLAAATVHHHLRKLLEEQRVVSQRDGRYMRYFATDCPARTRVLWSLLARDVPGRVLRAMLPMERGSAREIADAAGLREATVGADMTRLARRGLVQRDRAGTHFVYALVPEARHALLEILSPAATRDAAVAMG